MEEGLLKAFQLDQSLSLRNLEQVTRIRKKMERVIELQARIKSSSSANNLKPTERNESKYYEKLKKEAFNCFTVLALTSTNYLIIRNNRAVFNNPYTNHLFRPAFVATFLIMPNLICLYFAKLNIEKG